MNRISSKLIALLLLLSLVVSLLASCGEDGPDTGNDAGHTDYVSELRLDMNSTTAKQQVTVKAFIDGDTTHFNLSSPIDGSRVLKARYLAINTPESTGKVEEWGKKAASFTKEKLSGATSIYVESDNEKWNVDSTGSRHLVWVWYKTADSEEYRNLNLEILQNGLAIASNTAQNRYGETCVAALNQATKEKLHVYSGEKDPGFFYGEAIELTLKELRLNIEKYNGAKVAFNGVITTAYNQGVYIEDYDEESGVCYGMYIYYGTTLTGKALEILSIGNEARIVGTVSYWETGGSYQVSGLSYRTMKPNDPNNIQMISENNPAQNVLTDADTFLNGKVKVAVTDDDGNETEKEFAYANLALQSTITMKGLKVKSIYTTNNEDSSSNGAMTLTCEVDGKTVSVRTHVLYDENGKLITEDAFAGKTIDVQGIVDYYDGSYQIKVFSINSVTFVD